MIKQNVCCFSGHRNLKSYDFDQALLDRVVLDLIKMGTTEFLCGMAYGFDLAAARTVLMYKNDYEIKLTACLPCANQSDTFSQANKLQYKIILDACDEVITLSPYYYNGCMLERDRYMVDNSDILVCFLRKNSGGTFYTVNYARKQNKKIIEL